MTHQAIDDGGQLAKEGVGLAGVGDPHLHRSGLFAIFPVDRPAEMTPEDADPKAGTKEREVPVHYFIEQRYEFGLKTQLYGRLFVLRVGGVERSPAENHGREIVEVDVGQWPLFHPYSVQLIGV